MTLRAGPTTSRHRPLVAVPVQISRGVLYMETLLPRRARAEERRCRHPAGQRSGAHVELPFVEVVRCKSYTLTPQRLPSGLEPSLNLDGELSGAAPFQAACVPGALDVFASRLNTQMRDSSSELEPQLVLSLLRLLGQDRD